MRFNFDFLRNAICAGASLLLALLLAMALLLALSACSSTKTAHVLPEESTLQEEEPEITHGATPLQIGYSGKQTLPERVYAFDRVPNRLTLDVLSFVVDPAGDSVSVLTNRGRWTWAHPAYGEKLTVMAGTSISGGIQGSGVGLTGPKVDVGRNPTSQPDSNESASSTETSDSSSVEHSEPPAIPQGLLSGEPRPRYATDVVLPDDEHVGPWERWKRYLLSGAIGFLIGGFLGAIGPQVIGQVMKGPIEALTPW